MVSSYINAMFLLLTVFATSEGKACASLRFQGSFSLESLLLIQQNFSRSEVLARKEKAVDRAHQSELRKALDDLGNQWLLLQRRLSLGGGAADPRWRVLFVLASFVAATLAYQTWSPRARRVVKANTKADRAAFKPEFRTPRGEHYFEAKPTKGQALHGFSRVLSQVKQSSPSLAASFYEASRADAEANRQFCDKLLLQAQKRYNGKPRDGQQASIEAWRARLQLQQPAKESAVPGVIQSFDIADDDELDEDSEATQSTLNVVAGGVGGIEELRYFIDDSSVTWSLLRFQLGGGSSASTKFVLLHFNGENTDEVERDQLNSRTNEAIELFGETDAQIELTREDEVTLDLICDRVLPVLTSNSSEETSSASALKQAYESMIAEAQTSSPRSRVVSSVERTAKERSKGAAKTQDVLSEVAAAKGCYNWLLIDPDGLELHNGGYGGLEEMKEWLDETKVLFGVIRFTFAAATVKYVFVHWVGGAVGAVKRAKWVAKIVEAEAYCRKQCFPKLKQQVSSRADLKLEQIVREIRRLERRDTDEAAITVEEYVANLEQERFEHEGIGGLAGSKEAVEAVRGGGEGDGNRNWNWVMVGVPAQ